MDNVIDLTFDGPHQNGGLQDFKFYAEGGSPVIVNRIIDFLSANQAKLLEVNLSLYLCNNLALVDQLRQLAELGIEINIYSIPLEGYDGTVAKNGLFPSYFNHSILNNTKSGVNKSSKKDIAERVYGYLKHSETMNLFIYDHIYLRSKSVKPFSRGTAPYSLHIKNLYIKMKDGSSFTVITSSNLAVRDLRKEEMCIVLQNSQESDKKAAEFYRQLKRNSNELLSLNVEGNNSSHPLNFKEDTHKITSKHAVENVYFTGSFLHHSNSKVEAKLSKLISKAQRRVMICGQHVSNCALLPDKEKAKVEVSVLSQTYTDKTYDERSKTVEIDGRKVKPRTPQNSSSFRLYIDKLKNIPQAKCYFNNSIHLKFIVIDDHVVISTGNFTDTQFIYKDVSISQFSKMPNASYQGTFSEVNAYYIGLNQPKLAQQLSNHFLTLARLPATVTAFENH